MKHACNYECLKDDIIKFTKKYTDCFGDTYDTLKDYDYIKLYIIKDYNKLFDYKKDNHNLYNEFDIIKYINILNKLSNNIELNCNDNYYSPNSSNKDIEAYSFTISTKNIILCKIQLNCLRYLYECNNWNDSYNDYRCFKDIPKTLIEINSKLKTINILNKIILSHYISNSLDGGHDIVGNNYKTLYTKKEYLKLIEDNKDSCYNVFNTLSKKGTFIKSNEKIELKELLSTDVKKGYIYYKNLLKNIK